MLPLISQSNGSSAQAIGIFYFGSTFGWIVGVPRLRRREP
ncbi:Hypothetical protein NGAL_HAMBI2566_59870 [Neorhizobium galegae bv. orientalis]|nr:Hypothetical protein NGAL_HAMBI2566_59870 [Neorhizobium galegae bv. orientalis]